VSKIKFKVEKEKSICARTRTRRCLKKREGFVKKIAQEVVEQLVFLDESGANLSMCRRYARGFGGGRVKMAAPFDRGKTFSIIGAVNTEGVVAALYGEWATDGNIFFQFIENVLAPKLTKGQIVIMDNVGFHKINGIEELIKAKGAKLIYLPPYSPDLSPIENMWSKLKSILRKKSARTLKQFQKAIAEAFRSISTEDLIGWFKHCGYNPIN
jgi:transposase